MLLNKKPGGAEERFRGAAVTLDGRYLPPPEDKDGKIWVRTSAIIQGEAQDLYARWRDVEVPLSGLCGRNQSQSQGIVMLENSLQGRDEMSVLQTGRHLQQYRLVEAVDWAAKFPQPAHDRREWQRTDSDVG